MLSVESTRKRYLSQEEVHHFLPNTGGASLHEYRGKIDPAAMKRAIKLLCDRYPLLRSYVLQDENGYFLEIPEDDNETPEFIVTKAARTELLQKCYELHENMPPKVSGFILSQEGSGGYFGMDFNHAILDAPSLWVYETELWKLYTNIVNGDDIEYVEPAYLPRSFTEIQQSQPNAEHTEEIEEYERLLNESRNQVITDRIREELVQLSPSETSDMARTARASNTTVSALLTGIMAVTLRAQNVVDDKLPLTVCVMVNQRKYLDSPVSAAETTLGLAPRMVGIDSTRNPDPTVVAREFKNELDKEILRLKNRVDIAPLHRFDSQSTIYLNSAGVKPTPTTPDDVQITNLFFTKYHPDYPKYILGPKMLDKAKPVPCILHAFTAAGRLNLRVCVPDNPEANLFDEFLARCRNAKAGSLV